MPARSSRSAIRASMPPERTTDAVAASAVRAIAVGTEPPSRRGPRRGRPGPKWAICWIRRLGSCRGHAKISTIAARAPKTNAAKT